MTSVLEYQEAGRGKISINRSYLLFFFCTHKVLRYTKIERQNKIRIKSKFKNEKPPKIVTRMIGVVCLGTMHPSPLNAAHMCCGPTAAAVGDGGGGEGVLDKI